MSEVKTPGSPEQPAPAGDFSCCWWTDYVNSDGYPCNLSIRGPSLTEVMHLAGEAMERMKRAGCVPYFRYSYGKGNGNPKEGETNGVHGRAPGAQPAMAAPPAPQPAPAPTPGAGESPGVIWQGGTPYCTGHTDRNGRPKPLAMRPSTKHPGWYCPGKQPDGSYCPNKIDTTGDSPFCPGGQNRGTPAAAAQADGPYVQRY